MGQILLVEDNADLLNVLKQAIELSGHDVRAARNGAEGLRLLNAGNFIPDTIICDIAMPDMDGFAFLRHVRGQPEFAATYFIVMSGNGEDRDRVMETGADEYFPKPFSIHALLAALDRRYSI